MKHPSREMLVFQIVILVMIGLMVMLVWNPDWWGKSGTQRSCERQHGVYFSDRNGHPVCLDPKVTIHL